MAEPILVVKGASKSYGDLAALEPLDLTVPAGQRVALVGHNGSGKSTLLRLIAGLLELTEGTIDIDGVPAGSAEARALASFVPDDPVLYDDLSVREHLAYVASLHGVEADSADFDELLEIVGLIHRADDLPARFSRGLRQKTSLALGVVQAVPAAARRRAVRRPRCDREAGVARPPRQLARRRGRDPRRHP